MKQFQIFKKIQSVSNKIWIKLDKTNVVTS